MKKSVCYGSSSISLISLLFFFYCDDINALDKYDFKKIEESLKTEPIVTSIPMREFLQEKGHRAHFTSTVFVLKGESGIHGVFKAGEKEATAEVAAYRASEFLQLHKVPPTIFYEYNNMRGSLQYYIDADIDLVVPENYKLIKEKISPESWAEIELFYFIFGQWDGSKSNFIAKKYGDNYELFLIDNAAMSYNQKAQYGEYPFVRLWKIGKTDSSSTDFPFDQIKIFPPDKNRWKEEYGNILSDNQIDRLCKRGSPIRFIIWNGFFYRQFGFGEQCKTTIFPSSFIESLKKITLATAKAFFNNPYNIRFSEEFFNDILERKDQIIKQTQK